MDESLPSVPEASTDESKPPKDRLPEANERRNGPKGKPLRPRHEATVTDSDEETESSEMSKTAKQLCIIILMLSILTVIAMCMSALYICDRCRQRARRLKKFGAGSSEEVVSSKSSHSTPESFSTPPKVGKSIDVNFEKRLDAKGGK